MPFYPAIRTGKLHAWKPRLPTTGGGGGNLLSNGHFTTDAAGWGVISGTGSIASVGEVARVTSLGGGAGHVLVGQSFTTIIGQTYTVSGEVVSGGTAAIAEFRKCDNGDPALNPVLYGNVLTAGTYGGQFTATSTVTTIAMQVNGNGGFADFDNFSVVRP